MNRFGFDERPTRPDAAPSVPRGIARRLDRLIGRAAEAGLSALASSVRRERLTGLSPIKLRVIESALRSVRRSNVPGDFLEFSGGLGGSAIVIAAQIGTTREFHGFDMLGKTAAPDIGLDRRSDILDGVRESFDRFGLDVDGNRIALHLGRFEDTFDRDDTRSLAFVHIDCDAYEPVRFCLSAICPRLSPGALVVLDDYNDCGGCRRATDALLDSDLRFGLVRSGPSAVLRRI